MFVVVSDRLWSPSAPKRCQSSPVPQGRSSISLARLQTSYFADHFPSALGPLLKSWLAFIPLRLSCDKACSIFRIGRVSLGLFLPGKISHRKAVALDGPPTFRRPTRPGLYRHHLIGLAGVVVGHFPSLSHDLPLVLVDETPDQAGERLMLGSRFASSEKVSELDFCRRSAGRRVSFV